MKALLTILWIIGGTELTRASSRIRRTANVCTSQADGATFPVDGTCSSYYYCANQVAVELPCPINMQFSVSSAGCVSSASSDCQGITTITSIANTPTIVTRSDGGLTGNECYGQPQGALIPYPGDCTKYLVCQWYDGTVMNCPSGLHFNPVSCVCDWPTSAGCTQGSSPTPTTVSTQAPTPTPTTLTTTKTTPTPESTSSSTNSPTTLSSTPISSSTTAAPITDTTLTPTSTSSSTNLPTTTTSPENIPTLGPDDDICTNQPDGALFPYPWDCAWYIRCEKNTAEIVPCKDGWLFNSLLLICDYPENVGCIATPYPTTVPTPNTTQVMSTPTLSSSSTVTSTLATIPTPATGTTTTTSSTNSPTTPVSTLTTSTPTAAPITATTPTSSSTNSPTPTTTPQSVPTLGPDDDICTNQPDGVFFPYPWNCAWYIRCEGNTAETLPCQEGWLFNPILLICDYPDNAGCIATPYPTTDPTPNTTPTLTSSSTVTSTLGTLPTPATKTTPTTSSTNSPTPTTTPQSVPTLGPDEDICKNQPDGVFFPYPWDCAWYIRCEGNTAETLPCQEGWLFNPILLICDYPDNAGCIATPYPTTVPTPNTTPTPTSSSTVTSTLATIPTPATVATPTTSSTNSPTTPTPTVTTTPTPTTAPTPTTSFSTPTPTLITTEPSTKPPYVGTGICANQELGTLLPYPGKCSLYIVCEEPAPIAISCGPDLEFNAELKSCQTPEEAGCSIIKTTSSITESTTIELTTTPSTGSGICANRPIGDLIPYPGNCSQYIRCELPVPIALECLDDLEFNAGLQLCESAEDAGCSSFPSTTTVVPDITTTPPSSPGMTGVCRGQQEGNLIPYPGDCSKYIICENPIPIAQRCGADLHFNEELGICDEPDSAGCSDESSSTTIPPRTTTESPGSPGMIGACKGSNEGDLIPYPGSCTKYIRCELPVPIAQKCKAGLYFNEALGICDTSESASCPSYSTTTSPVEGTTTNPTTTAPKPPSFTGVCRGQELGDLIPYPGNCSKYIICENPVPIAIACTGGLHFNAELQICDDPVAAGCESTPSTTLPTSTPTPSVNNVCCGQPIGELVPYPEDCTQYIRCEYPIPVALSCCNDLHFNAVTQKCETIESANCQWYTTTTTTTTTTTAAPLTCETQPNGTLLPYDVDCKKYYYCSNGASVLLPCPGGTIFSQEAGGCVQGSTCPK